MATNVETVETDGGGIHRVRCLQRNSTIGFSGYVVSGLQHSASCGRLLYPLGRTMVATNASDVSECDGWAELRSTFVGGHDFPISCLRVSQSGKILISGEEHEIGTKVSVIVWDVQSMRPLFRHSLHHARVVGVAVSDCDGLAVSVGGDDDHKVVVCDVRHGESICESRSSFGRPFSASCVCFVPERDDLFLVGGGQDTVQVWSLDKINKKLECSIVGLGKIKRSISNMLIFAIDASHDLVMCGTSSGDVIRLEGLKKSATEAAKYKLTVSACAVKRTPRRHQSMPTVNDAKFSGGIHCILHVKENQFVVGSGDGAVSLVEDLSSRLRPAKKSSVVSKTVQEPTSSCLREVKSLSLGSAVTSLCRLGLDRVLVGCANGEMHLLDLMTFSIRMIYAAHTSFIRDVAFPRGQDRVCGTCGDDGVRLWDLDTGRLLLHVPQPMATCLAFAADGRSIVAGFADGCIRGFTPETGRLAMACSGAHTSGVSAVALAPARCGLVSGGRDGQVRTWRVASTPRLVCTVRDHKAPICSIHLTRSQDAFLSASQDGSCTIWSIDADLRVQRTRILHASSAIVSALYHPSESQVLMLSTDGQLSYSEVLDGSEIRAMQVGKQSALHSLDIAPDGEHFAIGGKASKAQGDLVQMGAADFGVISKVKFSPSGRLLVAVTDHGAINTWRTDSSL